MKHEYYGLKLMSFAYVNQELRRRLKYEVIFEPYLYDILIREIEKLKVGESGLVGRIHSAVDNILITTKTHENICEVGDKVIIGDLEGVIISKKFDVKSEKMEYYTDIEYEKVESPTIEKDMKTEREYLLRELQQVNDRIMQNNERKGFWSNFFSWFNDMNK